MQFTRLSAAKRSRLVQCFTEDVPASVAARLVLVNRKTVNAWYSLIRKRLLVEVSRLPEISSEQQFMAFHKRRILKFNGLSERSKQQFILESRLRYQLKQRFRGAVLDSISDLLD